MSNLNLNFSENLYQSIDEIHCTTPENILTKLLEPNGNLIFTPNCNLNRTNSEIIEIPKSLDSNIHDTHTN